MHKSGSTVRSIKRWVRMILARAIGWASKQFHRAAIDFAGDRAGRPADCPDANDRLHQRVHRADGQRLLRIEELEILATEEGLNQLARAAEKQVMEEERAEVRHLPDERQQRRNLRGHLHGHAHPQAGEPREQEANDNQGHANVAQKLAIEDPGHCPPP